MDLQQHQKHSAVQQHNQQMMMQAQQNQQVNGHSLVMPGHDGQHHYTSGPAFDNVTVTSSRPATGGNAAKSAHGAGVRKVQSSAFSSGGNQQPKEQKLQANKLRINQNSGQLHAPKVANNSAMGAGGQKNSFHLSKEAYQKLTANYNINAKGDNANRKQQIAYQTQDMRMQNSMMQQKYDEVRSAISNAKAPGTIQLKTSEQIRPHTGAGTFQSTHHSSNSGVFHKRTQSVKRPSRNTLNAHTTLESTMTMDKTAADPRFKMYNKEMIKGALEKRRVRRAQSNIRPRQRFSTITVFHKNDVSPAAQHEEGIMARNSNAKHQNETAYWSSNVNLNLERLGKKTRSYPIQGFNSGPAYSIPAQHYPGRVSPDKTDRSALRTPNQGGHAASSRSPMRGDIGSQRTISPISDGGDITPGCTDYTPRREQFLKQEPGYAPQRAERWFKQSEKEGLVARPHVYEDPNARTFRRSNSGSFTRAKRFNTPIDGSQVKAYLLTLKNRTAGLRQHSTGNLGFSGQSQRKFTMTGANVQKFDAASNLNVQEISAKKARPSTEQGRMRARRGTEPASTADRTREDLSDQMATTVSQSNKKATRSYRIATSSMHTPRFSANQRNAGLSSTITLDRSDIISTPGPACYETRVDSCIKESQKQTSFTTAPRWVVRKPTVNPEAPLYDTRPSSYLLHKTQPRVRIAEAKREISPHLFHAKNSNAFQKGVHLKP